MFRHEFLNAYRVTLEYTRSQANQELIQTLRRVEDHDTFRFGNMHDEWDRENSDPDDVFYHAQERREEVKEQIRQLQRALNRGKKRTR